MEKRIALIGLPASGKTSVGAILAKLECLPFADLDDEIVAASGSSIPDIFAVNGEAGFRSWEKKALAKLAAAGSIVLSTGGGCIETPENRALLIERFTTVWLKTSPAVAAERSVGGSRPLLAFDPVGQIETLYARRKAWYEECALLVVPTDGRSPEEVAEAIHDALR